ncbi:MAG: TPM domain-containing protein [Telluria sp.]
MKLLRYLWCLSLALMLAGQAHAQLKPVPPLTGRVVDQAGMLDDSQRQRLESVLADYEAQTGSQIAVLLVKSTEPEAIEQYGIRVTDQWKLGRKGVDDGVLLLVARDNPKALRRLRIEAGRGVQGSLTDAQSKRILQDVIAPHFRQNNYYDGLVAGVGAIATLLKQEKFPAPAARQAPQPAQQQSPLAALLPLLFVLIVVAGIASRFRHRGGGLSQGHSGWGSGTTGFILGNILAQEENRRRGGGGWTGGGFDGGGFSSGGGGFSGGGGSFDGGGASGDW